MSLRGTKPILVLHIWMYEMFVNMTSNNLSTCRELRSFKSENLKENLLWFLTIRHLCGINILVNNSEHVAQVCRETI